MRRLSEKRKLQLSWLLFSALAAVYLFVVCRYLIDYPFWDDYFSFMDFVADRAEGRAGFWKGLWEQHYEHRIVVQRLAAWLQYTLMGEINIAVLVIAANLLYVGFVLLCALVLARKPLGWMYVVVTALWLFVFIPWETIGWATTAWYIFPLYLFAALSFIAWRKNQMALCVLCAGAAVLSGANGIFVLPALAILHLLQYGWRNKTLWLLITVGALFFMLYMLGYERPSHQASPWLAVLHHPTMAMRYWLVITGNMAGSPHALRMALGVLGVLLLALMFYRQSWRNQPFAGFLLLFTALTLLVITLGRTEAGAGQAAAARYISFSSVYWLALLLLLAGQANHRIAVLLLLSFSALRYGYIAWQALPALQDAKTRHLTHLAMARSGGFSYFNYGIDVSDHYPVLQFSKRYRQLGIYPALLPKTVSDVHALPHERFINKSQLTFEALYDNQYKYFHLQLQQPQQGTYYAVQVSDSGLYRKPFMVMFPDKGDSLLLTASQRTDSFGIRPRQLVLYAVQPLRYDSMIIHLQPGDYRRHPAGHFYDGR